MSLFSASGTRKVKKYEVIKAVWPFCTIDESGNKVYTRQSEDDWVQEWKQTIPYVFLTMKQGWVSEDDKMEALMDLGEAHKYL